MRVVRASFYFTGNAPHGTAVARKSSSIARIVAISLLKSDEISSGSVPY
jgi:hypothetical protein